MIIFVKPVLSSNTGRSVCALSIQMVTINDIFVFVPVPFPFFIRLFYSALARHASRTQSEKDESLWDRNVDLDTPLASSYGEIVME